MNSALLEVLKKRKEDSEQYTTVGVGQGNEYDFTSATSNGGAPLPPRNSKTPVAPLRQLNFFTGHISDKSETGFTGLLNQGATCYLNALLQALYMTPELRQAVYEFTYNADLHPVQKSCIPLQLQRLFARLQISVKGAISTNDLTTSFGWTDRQVYVQHDVLELVDVLFDFIKTQSFGFRLSDLVSTYHSLNVLSYAQCLKCLEIRPRKDSSHGVGLDIEKATSFDDAMKRYITPDLLTEGNKVICDNCNEKTDTKKGYRFDSFPYILKVYFRRWTFNMMTLTRVKLDKAVPFPLEFDANEYIGSDGYWEYSEAEKASGKTAEKPKNQVPQIYELYAMLIHTGGAMGGHYYAYIRDFESGKWFQFNDSRVIEIPPDAFAEFFKTPTETEEKKKAEEITDDNEDTNKNQPAENGGDFALEDTTKRKLVGAMGGIDVSAALADSLKKKEDTRKRFENAKIPSDYGTASSGQNSGNSGSSKPSFVNPTKAAYMLIYRLKDPSKNINSVSKDCIPKELVEEINKEDEIYIRQREEYNRVKELLNMAIYYKGEIHEVLINKNATLADARQQIYDKLQLREKEQVESLQHMRLRKMKLVPKPVAVEPLTDDLLEKTLQQLQFNDVEHLWLEVRKPNEEFVKYEPTMMELRMVEIDLEKLEYKPELIVFAPEDGTVGDLRKACANMLGLSAANQLRLVFQAQETATLWINDDLKLKADQRLRAGDTIHVERCEHHLSGESILLKKFDDMLNVVTIRYNKLLKENEEVKYDQFINFDVRKTLGELKAQLSQALDVPVEELVIRRNYNDHELKDLAKSLLYHEIRTNAHIFVERGKPLKPTEFLFQIFIEDEVYKQKKREYDQKKVLEEAKKEVERFKQAKQSNSEPSTTTTEQTTTTTEQTKVEQTNTDSTDDNQKKPEESELPAAEEDLGEPFLFVGSVILDETWKMPKVKQIIYETIANMPHPDFMRIRDFTGSRLTKVYLDTKTLRANCGRGKNNVHDFQHICVQKTATKEHLTKDHLLLLVGRWYPRKMDFSVFQELAFANTTVIKTQLRQILSEYSGIKYEDIQVVRPLPYQVLRAKDRTKICIADWDMIDIRDDATLSSTRPWKCKNGEYLIFKDKNEKELYTREDFDLGLVSLAPFIREEVPLIFYTPEQQLEREREKEEQKKKEKEELSEAQKQAVERLQDITHQSAAKAQEMLAKST